MLSLKFISTIILTFCLFFSCDKPTEPKPNPEKDYKAYFFEQSGSQKLYIYSTLHNSLDSTILPYTGIDFIQASPDGKLLYLVVDNVIVIKTEDFSYVGEINITNISGCTISPDNKYIALVGIGLYVLQTSDFKVVYEDTTRRSSSAFFSENSKSLYCVASDSIYAETRFIQKLDLTTTPFTKTIKRFAYQYPSSIKLSSDEKKWYLTSSIAPYTSGFEVYDVDLDSLIFIFAMCEAGIDIEVSPDNNYVYFTNPGNFDCVLEPSIQIYDVSSNKLFTELSSLIDSVYLTLDTSVSIYLNPVYDFELNPTNSEFVFLAGVNNSALVQFGVIDLEQFEVILWGNYNSYYGEHYYFSNITMQKF